MALLPKRSSPGCARSPGRTSRVRSAGLLLITSVLLALLPQNAALAHGYPEPQVRNGWGYWSPTSRCVWSEIKQWHFQHEIVTSMWHPGWDGRSCALPKNEPAYSIQHRTEYYKSPAWLASGGYTKCYASWGWLGNGRPDWYTRTVIGDVWPACNWGAGVNVDITIDLWQRYAYAGLYLPSPGGTAWRPATHHCHCP
jgi:hypothetical protein